MMKYDPRYLLLAAKNCTIFSFEKQKYPDLFKNTHTHPVLSF